MKKVIFMICLCLYVITNFTAVFAFDGEYDSLSEIIVFGDYNNDGYVTVEDCNSIYNYVVSGNIILNERTFCASDVDDDAFVTFHDYVIVLNYINDKGSGVKNKVACGLHNGVYEFILYEDDGYSINGSYREGFMELWNWSHDYTEDSKWGIIAEKVKYVEIGAEVPFISKNIFRECDDLNIITVSGSNSYYSKDNVLYSGDKSQIITFPAAKTGDFDISDEVTKIADSAFYNSKITSVTIPEGMVEIADNAFYGCTALTDVYYDGTKSQWNKIKIGEGNESLKNAEIHYAGAEEAVTTVTTYEKNAEEQTITLKITLPDNLTDDFYLFVAGMNGNYLETVRKVVLEDKNIQTVTIPSKDVNKVKVFVWNSVGEISPITNAETVNVES